MAARLSRAVPPATAMTTTARALLSVFKLRIGLAIMLAEEAEAERARTTLRCVVIRTDAVNESEIRRAGDAIVQGVA